MPLSFRKVLIADERYETAAVFDVNNDGVPDIVSGAYWYEGPGFTKQHPVGEFNAVGEYFDAFCTVPIDVNGDGFTDFISCGWFSETLCWRENPGDPEKPWLEHPIARCGNIETACPCDIDGDGRPEILPNTPGGPLTVFKLVLDGRGKGTGRFSTHTIYDHPQGHGIGFGDIAGNGRCDVVLARGWLEAPEKPLEQPWAFHNDFDLGSASAPILVADVNGDGRNDLIVANAHDYGLDWWEQRLENGKRTWIRHPIDPFNSQYHTMQWLDIDNDGQCELVTGKRYRAHCGMDPGAKDGVGLYYFKWNGESFTKQIIDFGPPRVGKGAGLQFTAADLTGNGLLDIVAPGKDGLYVFYAMPQEGKPYEHAQPERS